MEFVDLKYQDTVVPAYNNITMLAPGELINKLEVELRRDERVLRFLTIALDKHAIAYNDKKRSGAFNKKPAAKVEDAN